MEFSIYVPKDKARILEALDEKAKGSGRPKNEIVLEALEAYLAKEPLLLKTYNLGPIDMPTREEIYDEVIERHYWPTP